MKGLTLKCIESFQWLPSQPGSLQLLQKKKSCSETFVMHTDIWNQSTVSILLFPFFLFKRSVRTIKYAILQNNPLFHMAPLFPKNTEPQMYNYFVWLYQITTQSPADCQENGSNPGLVIWKSQFQVPLVPKFMSRQSGAVESCHTQWSASVIILYKQVRKVNSTLWQCHTKKSYIICKPSEQWTVPQWTLYFYCKKMHLICDAGGGGRGKLLIFQESKVNRNFTSQHLVTAT